MKSRARGAASAPSSALRRIRHALHLFGCFKFEILAQVAIRPGKCDLLGVLWNFHFHKLFVFGLAFFQAAPGNDQRGGLLPPKAGCAPVIMLSSSG